MARPTDNPPPSISDIDAVISEETHGGLATGRRVSETSNVHDEGSDANDTDDGLTEQEEAVRHAAEDIPTGQDPAGPTEAIPVFDRGSLPPKI